MKSLFKNNPKKELEIVMFCLTIVCFCCVLISLLQNLMLCYELGANRAAIDAGDGGASESFMWQVLPQGVTLLSMAVCSIFVLLMLLNVKRNQVFTKNNANLIIYIGSIVEFNGVLQSILNNFIPNDARQTHVIYLLLGAFILFIGCLFKIGIRMKEEQDLTI